MGRMKGFIDGICKYIGVTGRGGLSAGGGEGKGYYKQLLVTNNGFCPFSTETGHLFPS
jgi:hypothetical protein